MKDSLRVQFIHGLEGSPQGSKARFLAEHFDACAPAMDTRDFASCVDAQARALSPVRPDVVVGSSFGGAVAVELLGRGAWRGPTLLLAQAALKLGHARALPVGVPVILVHGLRDDVVPIEDSRVLARTGTAGLVTLVEVDDDHRLQTLVDSGSLAELVRRVTVFAVDKERGLSEHTGARDRGTGHPVVGTARGGADRLLSCRRRDQPRSFAEAGAPVSVPDAVELEAGGATGAVTAAAGSREMPAPGGKSKCGPSAVT